MTSSSAKTTTNLASEINNQSESARDAGNLQQYATEGSRRTYEFIKDHPYRTGGMVLAAVPALAPTAVGADILGVVGFGSSGPILG